MEVNDSANAAVEPLFCSNFLTNMACQGASMQNQRSSTDSSEPCLSGKGSGLSETKRNEISVHTWNISLERHTEKMPATPDLIYHSVKTDVCMYVHVCACACVELIEEMNSGA